MDQETWRALNDLGKVVTKNAAEHNKLAHVVQRSHQEGASEKMTEALIKIVSATYEKAVAYTNVTRSAIWRARATDLQSHSAQRESVEAC